LEKCPLGDRAPHGARSQLNRALKTGDFMSPRKKQEIVTFKVDEPLWNAMRGISNRSEFIRSAILGALDSVCPLCKGSGILTPDERRHWQRFAKDHALHECDDCHAVHLVCVAQGDARRRSRKRKGRP
jgi:hypothetical protein